MALQIYVVEADNGESFKIYDQSTWAPFTWGNVSLVTLSVVLNSVTYTDKLYDTGDATNKISLDGTYANLFGTSSNSYYSVVPSDLLSSGGVQLSATHFPDGYYEITLDVTYSAVIQTDTTTQGFLSESYIIASQLPFTIDLDNFDYEENRIQFLAIAMLSSCKWAAELGRSAQFSTFTTKINSMFDARSLSDIWTS